MANLDRRRSPRNEKSARKDFQPGAAIPKPIRKASGKAVPPRPTRAAPTKIRSTKMRHGSPAMPGRPRRQAKRTSEGGTGDIQSTLWIEISGRMTRDMFLAFAEWILNTNTDDTDFYYRNVRSGRAKRPSQGSWNPISPDETQAQG